MENGNDLVGKVALVTGAGSGIGRATALSLAKQGAEVVLVGRRFQLLEAVAAEITGKGGAALAMSGDASEEAFVAKLVSMIVERFGGLDISIISAGVMGPLAPTSDVSLRDWETTLSTNLTAAFLAAKYQMPVMASRSGGSIVFLSSFVGYSKGLPFTAAYSASKSGLVGLTRALAAEGASLNIRVNALLPGGTETPMADAFASTKEAKDQVAELHLLKRIADPQEIAQAAYFLASDRSSFVTGTAMLVDGGVSIS